MTAYSYYYQKDNKHKIKMDSYFEDTIHLIKSEELKLDIINTYNNGDFIEKTTALTVLSIVKNYFSE